MISPWGDFVQCFKFSAPLFSFEWSCLSHHPLTLSPQRLEGAGVLLKFSLSLDEGERENEKAGLKLKIPKTKIMASSPISSWPIDRETMEIFLGSKITVDGDCSCEIKRCLLLGRKAVTNLESTLKSRDITLTTDVCLVKAVVFPVVMYRCESGKKRMLSSKELMLLNRGIGEDS